MPNHVHLLFKPLMALSKVMQRIKGKSAKLINTYMKRQGQFWFAGYYDKLIRDEAHFLQVYDYIKHNPLCLLEKQMRTRFYGIYE